MNAIPRFNPPSGGGGGKSDVSTLSADASAMARDLEMISRIRQGAGAVRAAGEKYLPKYPKESKTEYERRLSTAPWRPEFVDALQSMASKPFSKPVSLPEGTPEAIRKLAENIDGRGNNLHVFAREVFLGGLANGVHAILVDYPPGPENRTIAEEKASGARPYWVSIPATSIIAIYTASKGGREVVEHLRIREDRIEREGYGERLVEAVRVIEPKKWELWERIDGQYEKVDEGVLSMDEVPLALFFTGERSGFHRVRPPLLDLAHMQIELYQALSRQEEVLTYAGSPMLAAIGMGKPEGSDVVEVGPKTVLFTPPGLDGGRGDWKYVQPDAANIREVREQVATIITDMRRLGMQPMTAKSGDVTATATSVEAAKAHSAVEAWAWGLRDVLEHAFTFTERWIGETKATSVQVHTDFGVGIQSNEEAKTLLNAHAVNIISRKTARIELQRRGILGPQFDSETEDDTIETEPPAFSR